MWPLKPKTAVGLGKPADAEESMEVKAALKKKYPQMSQPGWGVAKAIKESRTKETGSAQHRMGMSNLSEDDYRAINKMRNKK